VVGGSQSFMGLGATLDASPRQRVLATSREALDVTGEVRWPVPALSLPDPRDPLSAEELSPTDPPRRNNRRPMRDSLTSPVGRKR
jgi:hypothetical protein